MLCNINSSASAGSSDEVGHAIVRLSELATRRSMAQYIRMLLNVIPHLTQDCANHGHVFDALKNLGSKLQGEVLLNAGKDLQAPPVWNNLLKGESPILQAGKPLCYAKCKSTVDVCKSVAFAVQHGLKVYARGEHRHATCSMCHVCRGCVFACLKTSFWPENLRY